MGTHLLKFRAEAMTDVCDLAKNFRGTFSRLLILPKEPLLYGIDCEIDSKITLKKFKNHMKTLIDAGDLVDCHIIYETINTASKYTGERS